MPKHEVKLGEKFKLGAWEWEVIKVEEDFSFVSRDGITRKALCLAGDDADSLDWIKPTPMISEDAHDTILEAYYKIFGCSLDEESIFYLREKKFIATLKSMIKPE